MGALLTKFKDLFRTFGPNHPARIVMIGLDAAGKTTVLNKLKFDDYSPTIPTIGFNVETITPCQEITMTVWDIGGQDKIRQLWIHYYQNTDGLVFVVDSTDNDRMTEAADELQLILQNEYLINVPLLILANKQDLETAMNIRQVTEKLLMDQIQDREWFVQGCSAINNGSGLVPGFQKLSGMLRRFRKNHPKHKKIQSV